MMRGFSIDSVTDPESNPFDRQERIPHWRQDKISKARIMIVGAGAIGNETLKNLALLGFSRMFIADFDHISTSNLSRTVLFRKSDVERKKAEVAAERVRELCLVEDARIDWFHGDVVWELGTGLYRDMDLVLGCLDNIEARLAINRQCWLANTPWIDAGMYELGIHVTSFVPPTGPCYECSLTDDRLKLARERYSCDNFKRKMFLEGKVPTVQVASAIASGIQVQEAVKLLCGQRVAQGHTIYYQGAINDFDVNRMPCKPDCLAHNSYDPVSPLPLSTDVTLEEFLSVVSRPEYAGEGSVLDFRGFRDFVVSLGCSVCGRTIEFLRPSFRIYDSETVCNVCRRPGSFKIDSTAADAPTQKLSLSEFGLAETSGRILGNTLRELGVPYWPVLAVRDKAGGYHYYELSGDRESIIPNMARSDGGRFA
ncbi:MAG: ThiF family adenylyltransferase [Pseudomonadota bacterium]